jgi:hypothetical protein
MKISSNRIIGLWQKLQPEQRLLVCCARTRIDTECQEQITSLVSRAIDWDYFLNLASSHHLLPLVYWNLNRICVHAVPQKVFISLWTHFEFVASRNKTLGLELIRLVKLFDSNGIPIIPYKGPAAAVALYENIALREFDDLDFLVRADDLPRVCELLDADGYETEEQYNSINQNVEERVAKEYRYWRYIATGPNQHPDSIYLEPHWSITMPRFPFPIDYPGLWQRAQEVNFEGSHILSFAPEDTVLILCVIGSKSQWKRFLMVSDFAQAIQTYRDIDWVRCLERATELGCERMFLTAIVLASELLVSTPSQELLERAQSDRRVTKLAQKLCNRFFQEVRPSVLRPWLVSPLLLGMRERPRDKLHYFVSTLTTPRRIHLRYLPLHKPLFPLYRLIVPVFDYLVYPGWRVGARIWDRAKSRIVRKE